MPILDLFSKRMKRLRGEVPDVYTYDELPQPLRVQIIHLWRTVAGTASPDRHYGWDAQTRIFWGPVNNFLKRERGVFVLDEKHSHNPEEEIAAYFLKEEDIELALDVVELVFSQIMILAEQGHQPAPGDAIEELNGRFQEHGVGYQFENLQIIRIDSQFIHSEAVKPTLHLLTDAAFSGPNDEFLRAHDHYRHQRHKECLAECLKAFESTMKVICDRQGWAYDKDKATATPLIDVCLNEGLVPSYLEGEFKSLAALLKSGLPTVRNKRGGHGQGAQIVTVPAYLASYALHLTAANILLLAQAETAMK